MILFATFTEYGDIWPTTIRRTEDAAVKALSEEPCRVGVAEDQLYSSGGLCLGSFEFSEITNFPPKAAAITWVRGWKVKR